MEGKYIENDENNYNDDNSNITNNNNINIINDGDIQRQTETAVESMSNFIMFELEKLNIMKKKTYFQDGNKIPIEMDFAKFLSECHKSINNKPMAVSINALRELFNLIKLINDIKDNIKSQFRISIREFDKVLERIDYFQNANQELYEENEDLKLKIAQTEAEAYKRENELLKNFLSNGGKLTLEQTTEESNSIEIINKSKNNDNHINNSHIVESNFEEMAKKTYNDNNSDDDILYNLNDASPDEIEYIKNLSTAHKEVLEAMPDELLPIHKTNINESKNKYTELWGYISLRNYLSEDDLPEFIEYLDDYKDKPDDYFDDIENIERLDEVEN